MPNGTTFVIFAFLIRIVSGFGAATTSTASLTLLTETFQDDIASAMVTYISILISLNDVPVPLRSFRLETPLLHKNANEHTLLK